MLDIIASLSDVDVAVLDISVAGTAFSPIKSLLKGQKQTHRMPPEELTCTYQKTTGTARDMS